MSDLEPAITVRVRDMDQKPTFDGFHMLATVETMREAAATVIGYALGLGGRSPAAGFDTAATAEDLEANALGEYWHWITAPTPMASGRDTRLAVKLTTPATRKGN